jgi:hypothetical protein
LEFPLRARLPRQLIVLQLFGFALVLAMLWADELLDLPHILFHATATPRRLSEAVFESSIVAVLGLVSMSVTVKLTRRIIALESYVVLCGWCRRIRDQGRWFTLEAFLTEHQANASHGLCPECAAKLEAEV